MNVMSRNRLIVFQFVRCNTSLSVFMHSHGQKYWHLLNSVSKCCFSKEIVAITNVLVLTSSFVCFAMKNTKNGQRAKLDLILHQTLQMSWTKVQKLNISDRITAMPKLLFMTVFDCNFPFVWNAAQVQGDCG